MINICIIATIVIYLVGMLLVGFVYSKSNEDSSDFYLGGRTMGPLVTAMSAEASDMSSWLLMGMPGLAYLTGIASPGWTAIGLAVGTWLNWLIVARRLRRYSANLDAITVPQFLSLRFHDQRNLLNALGAVIIIVFFIPYTASGFAACGKLFNSLFGVDYMAAMVLSAVVIVGYTIMGGFRAVSTTDLIQSVVNRTQKLLVRRQLHAVHMRYEVALCNASSDSFVENTVRDPADASVRFQMHHAHTAVMMSAHEKIAVAVIHFHIAASHSADPLLVDRSKIAVLLNTEGFHTLIRNGIQKSAVLGDNQIRRIVDRNHLTFRQFSRLNVYIIDMDSYAVLVCISSYICNILLLLHRLPPSYSFLRKMSYMASGCPRSI